jgi:hypothetical protein
MDRNNPRHPILVRQVDADHDGIVTGREQVALLLALNALDRDEVREIICHSPGIENSAIALLEHNIKKPVLVLHEGSAPDSLPPVPLPSDSLSLDPHSYDALPKDALEIAVAQIQREIGEVLHLPAPKDAVLHPAATASIPADSMPTAANNGPIRSLTPQELEQVRDATLQLFEGLRQPHCARPQAEEHSPSRHRRHREEETPHRPHKRGHHRS